MNTSNTEPLHSSHTTIKKKSKTTITDKVRELVARYIVDQRHSVSEASATFSIKASTASRIASVYRIEGRTKALKRGGTHNQKLTDDMKQQVRAWVDEECTTPLAQMANKV